MVARLLLVVTLAFGIGGMHASIGDFSANESTRSMTAIPASAVPDQAESTASHATETTLVPAVTEGMTCAMQHDCLFVASVNVLAAIAGLATWLSTASLGPSSLATRVHPGSASDGIARSLAFRVLRI